MLQQGLPTPDHCNFNPWSSLSHPKREQCNNGEKTISLSEITHIFLNAKADLCERPQALACEPKVESKRPHDTAFDFVGQ